MQLLRVFVHRVFVHRYEHFKMRDFNFLISSPQLQGVWNCWPAYHDYHETCHFVKFYFMKKEPCDTATPQSIHTKDESKCCSAFAFIFGVN